MSLVYGGVAALVSILTSAESEASASALSPTRSPSSTALGRLVPVLSIKAAYESVGDSVKLPDIFGGATVRLGDDCAALQTADGWLLFAMEGLIELFVNDAPWFAGYSAVMVNTSDIYAMGGRPMAVTNALWLGSETKAKEIWAGMLAASQAYGVPIVGGHTAHGSQRTNLAVSVLGRANRLLTAFDARPGDRLLVAVDLRGELFNNYPFWNASTQAPAHLFPELRVHPQRSGALRRESPKPFPRPRPLL